MGCWRNGLLACFTTDEVLDSQQDFQSFPLASSEQGSVSSVSSNPGGLLRWPSACSVSSSIQVLFDVARACAYCQLRASFITKNVSRISDGTR
ncbi:hypothetical protein CLOP_g151 [Closterium sp. NIES-67]|nr:hypothetical protein CLOP_g151 [Closterium sp. NIES-67]